MDPKYQIDCKYKIDTETPHMYYCVCPNVSVLNNITVYKICRSCPHRRPVDGELPQVDAAVVAAAVEERAGVLPSVAEQLGNATRAAAETISSVMAGNPMFVTNEEKQRRLTICGECPNYNSGGNRCNLCGCGLSSKAAISSSSCPILKW